MTEITVTIKGVENSYKQKFVLYEPYAWTESDPTLIKCVEEALQNSRVEPEDIIITGRIQYK